MYKCIPALRLGNHLFKLWVCMTAVSVHVLFVLAVLHFMPLPVPKNESVCHFYTVLYFMSQNWISMPFYSIQYCTSCAKEWVRMPFYISNHHELPSIHSSHRVPVDSKTVKDISLGLVLQSMLISSCQVHSWKMRTEVTTHWRDQPMWSMPYTGQCWLLLSVSISYESDSATSAAYFSGSNVCVLSLDPVSGDIFPAIWVQLSHHTSSLIVCHKHPLLPFSATWEGRLSFPVQIACFPNVQ